MRGWGLSTSSLTRSRSSPNSPMHPLTRYEAAIADRLRKSQAVKIASEGDRSRAMVDLLPHERARLLREEKARARWMETQK